MLLFVVMFVLSLLRLGGSMELQVDLTGGDIFMLASLYGCPDLKL